MMETETTKIYISPKAQEKIEKLKDKAPTPQDATLARITDLLEVLDTANAAKDKFMKKHDAIFKEKRGVIDTNVREAERMLTATIAVYAQAQGAIHPDDPTKDNAIELPDGIEVQTRYMLDYDPAEASTWIRTYAQYLLTPKWAAFEQMAKTYDALSNNNMKPDFDVAPPTKMVRAILPVIRGSKDND